MYWKVARWLVGQLKCIMLDLKPKEIFYFEIFGHKSHITRRTRARVKVELDFFGVAQALLGSH